MVARRKWLARHALALASVLGCLPKPPPTDIGCSDEFEDSRQVDLCDRIRKNLEWKRGGHDTPFSPPSWKCTKETVAKVTCSKPEIRVEDVSAAYAVARKGKVINGATVISSLVGCLGSIQDAIQGRTLPKSDPRSGEAVFCSPDD